MSGFITNHDVEVIAELPAGSQIIGEVGLDTTAVTVGTSAVALPASTLTDRKTIFLQNNSNTTIYLGGSAVTTADGIKVLKGDSFSIDIGSVVLYAIAGSAGNEVRVMEIS